MALVKRVIRQYRIGLSVGFGMWSESIKQVGDFVSDIADWFDPDIDKNGEQVNASRTASVQDQWDVTDKSA